eukprot:7611940-Karenia_brevis.AAC.1
MFASVLKHPIVAHSTKQRFLWAASSQPQSDSFNKLFSLQRWAMLRRERPQPVVVACRVRQLVQAVHFGL